MEENDAQQQEQDAAAAQKLKDTLYAINEKGVLFCMVESVGDREEDGSCADCTNSYTVEVNRT